MTVALQPDVQAEILATALDGRRTAFGWRAHCPAHEDTHPSFDITVRGDQVVFLCRAGCSQESVIAALTRSHLWPLGAATNGATPIGRPRRTSTPPPTPSAREDVQQPASPYRPADMGRDMGGGKLLQHVHVYRNQDGNAIAYKARTVRDGTKSFLWGRKNAMGLGGLTPLLYGTEKLASIPLEEPIDVVEGELCTEVMWAAGFHAVCSPHGASRDGWTELAPLLTGRIVRLWPDNDDPGRAHMAAAYTALQGIARQVVWVELPDMSEKGDVADFLDTHPLEELRAIADCALQYNVTPPAMPGDARVESLATIEAEDVVFLWDPYIPRGKLTLVEGNPGTNKSYAMLALAAGITRGERPDGSPTTPERVLLLCAEDGLADTVRPRLEALGADLGRVHVLTGVVTSDGDAPFVLDGEGVAALDRAVAQLRPALVVVDPLFAFIDGALDIYRANQVRAMLAPLIRLAERHGCALVGLRHLNKTGGTTGITRGLGSIDFSAAARSVLLFSVDPHSPAGRVMSHTKSSLAPNGPSLSFALVDDAVAWQGESDLPVEDLLMPDSGLTSLDEAREFLGTVLADGPRPTRDVLREAADMGIAERTLRRAVRAAGISSQRISTRGDNAGKGLWFWVPNKDGSLLT